MVKDKGGKEGTEGASLLGEAFILEEEGPLVIMDNAPAVVGGLVKEVEEGEEVGKVRMDGIATGGAGTGIEHVDTSE